jgi:hypothetical protein
MQLRNDARSCKHATTIKNNLKDNRTVQQIATAYECFNVRVLSELQKVNFQ